MKNRILFISILTTLVILVQACASASSKSPSTVID